MQGTLKVDDKISARIRGWHQRFEDLQAHGLYFFNQPIEELCGGVRVRTGGREMLMFASYGYLGLLGHPRINAAAKAAIDAFGTGTHGVRLLAGTLKLHTELEQTIARFKHTDAAVTFSSGYVTNLTAISTMVGRHDVVICDKLNHASIVDGCLLSGADLVRFRHNDMADLERCLQKVEDDAAKLVVVDAVFSMDGDIVNLPRVVELCQKYGAWLMVDEAHSIGVLGRQGRGLAEHFGLAASQIDILMGTLSKSLASCGGYVAGGHDLIRYLRYTCPGFIFSAGISPANAAAALKAIEMVEAEPWRVEGLRDNALAFSAMARARGLDTGPANGSGVIPVMVGEDAAAILLSNDLFAAGLNVQPLVSPAVDPGKARLRFFISCLHTNTQLAAAVDLTAQKLRSIPQWPAAGSPA